MSGADVAQCRMWISECLDDSELQSYVLDFTRGWSDRAGLADLEVRASRRARWYALIRSLRPLLVVETRTDKGAGFGCYSVRTDAQ